MSRVALKHGKSEPGFEPQLNGIPIDIHLTTYRCGRLLLNEVKLLSVTFNLRVCDFILRIQYS